MADWLVPVSDRTRFVDKSGKTLTARLDVVRSAALDGRLVTVLAEVRGALADLRSGDQVWVFWPDRDVGVLAVGRARLHAARQGAELPPIAVELDRTRTRALAVDPMPAGLVRRWLSDLRGGSRLDVHPRALEAVRAWEHERAERDDTALRPLGVATWRDRALRGGKSRPADDPLLAPLVPFLRSQNFAVGVDQRAGTTRLVARRVRDVLLIHRVGAADRSRDEALLAFANAREHRWSFERAHADLRLRAWAWLAFGHRPAPSIVSFLEAEGVLVTWPLARGPEMSDRSKQRWYQEVGLG
jgi:hypothetical protein